MIDPYLSTAKTVLERIVEHERGVLEQAVCQFTKTIAAGRIIHTFGTGHSSLLACEGLYRAGGLACINAILEPFTTFASGARAGSQFERTPGLAEMILERYQLAEGDTLVIFSNSGVNTLPVEMAQAAKARRMSTIAVLSRAYATASAQRKGLSVTLLELADLVIDNHVPPGDATLALEGGRYRVGPVSTIAGAFIWNVLVSQTAAKLLESDIEPPVFISSNMPQASENNDALIERYRTKIRHL